VLLVAGSLGLGAWTALAQTVIVRTTSVPLNGSHFQGGDGDQEKPDLIDWLGMP